MTYLIISTIGFIINLIFLKKRVLEYAIMSSLIYLISFIFIQSFDILFVEYAFFFVIPHIKDFRRINYLYFVFLIYIIIELIVGLMNEPIISVAATFLTRFFPIIFISLIDKKGSIIARWNEEYEQKLLRLIVVCELIVSFVLFFKGNRGNVFVVSHQPVGANLSLVGTFLSLDISLKPGTERERHRIENIFYLTIFAVFAIISGIRGYIVIVIPCTFYAIIAYVFVQRNRRRVGLFLTALLTCIILLISYFSSGKLASFIANIDTSVGYRKLENELFIQSIKQANPLRWIFGYGIGARGERFGSESLISTLARGSVYYTNHLTNAAILLNFWLTVFKDMGFVGFIVYLVMYSNIVPRRTSESKDRRVGWILYAILYAFMLLYRTSCTNGLVELYMFTMIMNNPLFVGEKQKDVVQDSIDSTSDYIDCEIDKSKGNKLGKL